LALSGRFERRNLNFGDADRQVVQAWRLYQCLARRQRNLRYDRGQRPFFCCQWLRGRKYIKLGKQSSLGRLNRCRRLSGASRVPVRDLSPDFAR